MYRQQIIRNVRGFIDIPLPQKKSLQVFVLIFFIAQKSVQKNLLNLTYNPCPYLVMFLVLFYDTPIPQNKTTGRTSQTDNMDNMQGKYKVFVRAQLQPKLRSHQNSNLTGAVT